MNKFFLLSLLSFFSFIAPSDATIDFLETLQNIKDREGNYHLTLYLESSEDPLTASYKNGYDLTKVNVYYVNLAKEKIVLPENTLPLRFKFFYKYNNHHFNNKKNIHQIGEFFFYNKKKETK